MQKFIKTMLSLTLSFILFLSVPISTIGTEPATAYAATVSGPQITVSKLNLYVGYKTYQLKFTNLNKSSSITFRSSNTKVAKVSNNGIITPITKGSSTIKATVLQNSKRYTSKVKVTVDNSNIEITTKTNNLSVGDEYTFKAKAYGTDSKIVWSVSDPSIAKIDRKSGELTALSEGETEVIITAGNISSRCTVEIYAGRFTTDSQNLICNADKIIWITVDDIKKNENIYFHVDDPNVVTCEWGDFEGNRLPLLIRAGDIGSTTITISSDKTSDVLKIHVSIIKNEGRAKNAKELSAKEIYEKCASATVEIQVTTQSGDYLGSGFFIRSGLIVTNYHVIEGATKITVITHNNKSYEVKDIVACDENYDIAILDIDAVTEFLVDNGEDFTVGDTVYALGSPRGLTGSLTDGIISSISRISDGVDYIQITAPISAGNSGGPLINAYGEVIGINTFILMDSQNLNFALNIYQIYKINLNSSITAEEFYKTNISKASATVYEDESKSGELVTSQEVAIGNILVGELEASNYVDFYHIKITKANHLFGVIILGNEADYDNICFRLMDKNFNYMCDSLKYTTKDNEVYHCIDADLPVGDYYIAVFRYDKYTTNSMKYSFKTYLDN